MFYGHLCAQGRLKGNEAKSKTKQPSDMPTPRFEHGGSDLWSNTAARPRTSYSPDICRKLYDDTMRHE